MNQKRTEEEKNFTEKINEHKDNIHRQVLIALLEQRRVLLDIRDLLQAQLNNK